MSAKKATDEIRDQLRDAQLAERNVSLVNDGAGVVGLVIAIDDHEATILPRCYGSAERVRVEHIGRVRVLDVAAERDRKRAREVRARANFR